MLALPKIDYEHSIIPRVIFQTWKKKELPPDMAIAVEKLKNANPGFVHELFDDNDCRQFIREHFPNEVLYAFDTLKPGAYKADLWRYCVLYIHGGVYIDIKYTPVNGFSFESLIHNEHLCKDIPVHFMNGLGIYNAIMIMMRGNPLLAEAIQRIYIHCINKQYGINALYVTGPGLLGEIVPHTTTFSLRYNHPDIIQLNGKPILKAYKTYRRNVGNNTLNTYYSVMWNKRNIYNS